jgi:hypothetical protein
MYITVQFLVQYIPLFIHPVRFKVFSFPIALKNSTALTGSTGLLIVLVTLLKASEVDKRRQSTSQWEI